MAPPDGIMVSLGGWNVSKNVSQQSVMLNKISQHCPGSVDESLFSIRVTRANRFEPISNGTRPWIDRVTIHNLRSPDGCPRPPRRFMVDDVKRDLLEPEELDLHVGKGKGRA